MGAAMDKFLQVVGFVGAASVVLVLLIVIFTTRRGPDVLIALAAALPWALPAMVAFVMIAAFGNMLSQLKAIRASSEKQAELFQSIMDSRKAKVQ